MVGAMDLQTSEEAVAYVAYACAYLLCAVVEDHDNGFCRLCHWTGRWIVVLSVLSLAALHGAVNLVIAIFVG